MVRGVMSGPRPRPPKLRAEGVAVAIDWLSISTVYRSLIVGPETHEPRIQVARAQQICASNEKRTTVA
jgi:hypothetical protein